MKKAAPKFKAHLKTACGCERDLVVPGHPKPLLWVAIYHPMEVAAAGFNREMGFDAPPRFGYRKFHLEDKLKNNSYLYIEIPE